MKSENKLIHYRSKLNQEKYYHYSSWETRMIEGVEFLPVTKFSPESDKIREVFWLKKDSLEVIAE
jgi:hypothetical protein